MINMCGSGLKCTCEYSIIGYWCLYFFNKTGDTLLYNVKDGARSHLTCHAAVLCLHCTPCEYTGSYELRASSPSTHPFTLAPGFCCNKHVASFTRCLSTASNRPDCSALSIQQQDQFSFIHVQNMFITLLNHKPQQFTADSKCSFSFLKVTLPTFSQHGEVWNDASEGSGCECVRLCVSPYDVTANLLLPGSVASRVKHKHYGYLILSRHLLAQQQATNFKTDVGLLMSLVWLLRPDLIMALHKYPATSQAPIEEARVLRMHEFCPLRAQWHNQRLGEYEGT